MHKRCGTGACLGTEGQAGVNHDDVIPGQAHVVHHDGGGYVDGHFRHQAALGGQPSVPRVRLAVELVPEEV
jgi:hypothetical protein